MSSTNRQEILLTAADFLAGLAVPYLAPVVTFTRLVAQIAGQSPEWRPSLEATERAVRQKEPAQTMWQTELALLQNPPPGVSCEDIADIYGYRVLWRDYPKHVYDWVPPISSPPVIAPFIELWTAENRGSGSLPLKFQPRGKESFRAPVRTLDFEEAVRSLRPEGSYTNDAKVWICGHATDPAGFLTLEYGCSDYRDYVHTAWAVANLPYVKARALRELTCGLGGLNEWAHDHTGNHLGVSALVAFGDSIPLWRSSSKVVSSPDRIVPSCTGSADFHAAYWDHPPGPAVDIMREAHEELQLDIRDFRRANVRVLAFLRNVLRGGNPELVYCMHVPERHLTSTNYWEFRHEAPVLVPALLGPDEEPLPNFDEREAELVEMQRMPAVNGARLAPITRVALHYYVRYARARRATTP